MWLFFLFSEGAFASRLSVSGDHFVYNGEKVFLSGGSLPWINYAHDFGNNQWAGVKSQVENQMKMLRDAGGNTMSKNKFSSFYPLRQCEQCISIKRFDFEAISLLTQFFFKEN